MDTPYSNRDHEPQQYFKQMWGGRSSNLFSGECVNIFFGFAVFKLVCQTVFCSFMKTDLFIFVKIEQTLKRQFLGTE